MLHKANSVKQPNSHCILTKGKIMKNFKQNVLNVLIKMLSSSVASKKISAKLILMEKFRDSKK